MSGLTRERKACSVLLPSRCLSHSVCEGVFSRLLLLSRSRERGQAWGETTPGQPRFSNCSWLCVCSSELEGGNSLHKDRKAEVLCGKGKAHSDAWYDRRVRSTQRAGQGSQSRGSVSRHHSPPPAESQRGRVRPRQSVDLCPSHIKLWLPILPPSSFSSS